MFHGISSQFLVATDLFHDVLKSPQKALPLSRHKELLQLGLPQLVLTWGSMYGIMSAMEQVGLNLGNLLRNMTHRMEKQVESQLSQFYKWLWMDLDSYDMWHDIISETWWSDWILIWLSKVGYLLLNSCMGCLSKPLKIVTFCQAGDNEKSSWGVEREREEKTWTPWIRGCSLLAFLHVCLRFKILHL